jgi:hypothetical protein
MIQLMQKFIVLALLLFGAAGASADEAAIVQSVYAHSDSHLIVERSWAAEPASPRTRRLIAYR